MRVALLAAILSLSAGADAQADHQLRVCSKYSTILLNDGESAEVEGAGQFSLSLLVKGARGNWIFYDSIAEPDNSDNEGTVVMSENDKTVYRRSHDLRIYFVQQTRPAMKEGKIVKAGVMGVNFMRQPLDHPAIVGDDTDLEVITRVLPGSTDQCDLTFVAGKGLVPRP